ncbi:LysR family transcriptional regulator [Achromobacter xylosoxidans]
MELRHLRYFIAIVEAGTFTRAAERLHTAQPSLSRQIRDLEDFLQVALFERSTRSVKLTEAGTVFLNEARRCSLRLSGPSTQHGEPQGPSNST